MYPFILKDLTLHSLDRPAFVAFTTAGFPTPAETVDILLGLEKGGADVIELGKLSIYWKRMRKMGNHGST